MNYGRKIIYFCLLALSVLSTGGQASQVQIEVTGTGLTTEAAIEQGLITAVRQVNGTNIETISQSRNHKVARMMKLISAEKPVRGWSYSLRDK